MWGEVKVSMTQSDMAVVTRLILRDGQPADSSGPLRPLESNFELLPGGVLHRALEELDSRLNEVCARYQEGDLKRVGLPLRKLCAAAAQIGLPHVLAAAEAFSTSCAATDPVALAATLARLTRACDAALSTGYAFEEAGARGLPGP